MQRRPEALKKMLRQSAWGLARARAIAADVYGSKIPARALVRELFSGDAAVRKRAADVARRLTDMDGHLLEPYADELAGLLESLAPDESRTRWHLGLVVPRVASSYGQRLRAARAMYTLAEDSSNVVRCSAVEGMALLASKDASLRDEAEAMIASFLRSGTSAMKCRARHAQRLLLKRSEQSFSPDGEAARNAGSSRA